MEKKYSKDNLFKKTSLYKDLLELPINFVDIGARGDFFPLINPISDIVKVIGFEPDKKAALELINKQKKNKSFAGFEVISEGLFNKKQKKKLFELSAKTNNSIFKPNYHFIDRYKMIKWIIKNSSFINVDCLDKILKKQKQVAEIIKIDTQGSEYEILEGAKNTLKKTVCVIVEVSFCELYEKQKFFSEVELLLRKNGFCFYGFNSFHNRSKKFLKKDNYKFRERIFQTDAIFFKDPFKSKVNFCTRDFQILFLSALLNNFADFAYEIAKVFLKKDYEILIRFVKKQVAYDYKQTIKEVENLRKKIKANRKYANRYLGSFIDERRLNCDFKDIFNIKA